MASIPFTRHSTNVGSKVSHTKQNGRFQVSKQTETVIHQSAVASDAESRISSSLEVDSSHQTPQVQVVVTREAGKNGPLKRALEERGIKVLEMPLVETAPGPDRWAMYVFGRTSSLCNETWRAACSLPMLQQGRPVDLLAQEGTAPSLLLFLMVAHLCLYVH